ncbi:hypothetical protein [Lentzea sp. NPDC055074]
MKKSPRFVLRRLSILLTAVLAVSSGLMQGSSATAYASSVKPGWDAYFNTPNAKAISGGHFCWGDACGNPNAYQIAAVSNVNSNECVGNPGGPCSNQFDWRYQNEWVAHLSTYGAYKYLGLQNTIQSAPQGGSPAVWPALDQIAGIQVQLRGQFCGGNEAYGRVPSYVQFVDPVYGKGEINVDLLSHVGSAAPRDRLTIATPGGSWTTEAELMRRGGNNNPPREKERVFQFPGRWSVPANGASNDWPCRGGAGSGGLSSAPWLDFYINVPFLVSELRNSGVMISSSTQFTGSILGGAEFWSTGAFGEVEIKNYRVYMR